MNFKGFLYIIFFIPSLLLAQEIGLKSKLDFELYSDFFINGTFNNQPSHKISDYLYSYNRTNEFAINLAYLKAKYNDSNFRMNLAFMTGTYGTDNYAGEDGLFRNLFEANVGFKLSKKRNEWIDIGVFPSHIGFESAIGYDCWNVSRSLLAENSPYFETGIKYTNVSKQEKWTSSILLLNGWQKITMNPGYSIPALGMQFVFKPSSKFMANYSNFIGSQKPDSASQLRVYQNIYMTYFLTEKLQALLNFDIGRESLSNGTVGYWYGMFGGFRFQMSDNNILAWRAEFLEDRDNILYPELNNDWFTWTSSLNFDRRINPYSLLRFEVKYMNSTSPIFHPNSMDHIGAFLALQVKL